MELPRAIFYEKPINMRLSAKKLSDFVRWSGTKLDSGDIFIFFNRKRDHCKIIWDDGQDFSILEKRLDKGTFAANENITLTQDIIDSCIFNGIAGQKKLLHALMGNVIYLDKARK